MASLELTPATPALLDRFYGGPPQRSMRALVVMRGEEIVMVAGIYTQPTMSVIFSEFPEHERAFLRRHLKIVVRCMRWVRGIAKTRALPVFAVASSCVKGSDRFLEHYGFVRFRGDTYRCSN